MAHKNYSTEAMTKAMEAVASGATASSAAKEYCVPRTTLLDKVNGRSSVDCVKGPATVLTEKEEEHLENWLIFMANSGFPVTKDQLQGSVSLLLKKLGRKNPFRNDKPGRHWFEAFVKRHPKVGQRLAQNLTQTRAVVKEKEIRSWFKEIEEYYTLVGLKSASEDPRRIFNCDESAFFLAPNGNRVLAKRGSKNVYNVIPSGERECVTVLITANAAGDLAPPMVLYKLKSIPHKISKGAPGDWGLGHTAKGWMTGEAFYEYITNVFFPWLERSRIPVPVIFFLDGHCSHTTLPLSNFCSEKKITLIALHPNATHILQPMDVSVFRPLKMIWKKTVYEWRNENQFKKLKKENFCPLLRKALTQLEPSTIANGFRKCGLSPFNANNVDYTKCVTALNDVKPDNFRSHSDSVSHLRFFESQISPSTLKAFNENKGSTWEGDTSFEALFSLWRKIKIPSTETENHCINNDKSMFSELGNFTGYSNILDNSNFLNDVSEINLTNNMLEYKDPEENEGLIELFELVDGNLTKIINKNNSIKLNSSNQCTIDNPIIYKDALQQNTTQKHNFTSVTSTSTGQIIRTIASKPIYLTPYNNDMPTSTVTSSIMEMSYPMKTSLNDEKATILSSQILNIPTTIEQTESSATMHTLDYNHKNPLSQNEIKYFTPVKCTPSKVVLNVPILSTIEQSGSSASINTSNSNQINQMPLSQIKIPYFTSVECTPSKVGDNLISASDIPPFNEKREASKQYYGDLFVPTPFKDALFWPEAPPYPNAKKVKIPSVITSERWQIFAQKKRDKKTENEKKKSERKERNQRSFRKEPKKISTTNKTTRTQRITQKSTGTEKVAEKDWFCRLCETSAKLDMIRCLSCMVWYHTSCAEVRPTEVSFYCIYCNDLQRKKMDN